MIIQAILSIGLNVIIAILGLVPSIFITLYNVNVFGLFYGFLVSLIGEVLGAIVSFYLYRRGFKGVSQRILQKYPKINDIINTKKRDQVSWVVLLRLFPYIPSGIVTYGAAISSMDIKSFTIASTVGKIPAMVLEVGIAFGVLKIVGLNEKIINVLLGVIIIMVIIIKIIKRKR